MIPKSQSSPCLSSESNITSSASSQLAISDNASNYLSARVQSSSFDSSSSCAEGHGPLDAVLTRRATLSGVESLNVPIRKCQDRHDPKYRREECKEIERLAGENRRLSRQCEILSSSIHKIKEEINNFNKRGHVTIGAFQNLRNTLINDKQVLLNECDVLVHKVSTMQHQNATS